MPKKKEAEGFTLADDYTEEYQQAKVTLVEEEQEVYDLGEKEASKAIAVVEPYHRKKQFKRLKREEAEEILPTAHQPGLLIRRLKTNA